MTSSCVINWNLLAHVLFFSTQLLHQLLSSPSSGANYSAQNLHKKLLKKIHAQDQNDVNDIKKEKIVVSQIRK